MSVPVMRHTSTKLNFGVVMGIAFLLLHVARWRVNLHLRCGLRLRTLGLTCGLAEPGFKTRLAESRVVAGKERPLAHLYAVIARVRVSDNLARILAYRQISPDKFIEMKLFRPAYFNGAVH